MNGWEIGTKNSSVAFFIFRDGKKEFNTINQAKDILTSLHKKDASIYCCQCSTRDELRNKLDAWCRMIGKLEESHLKDEQLNNENELPLMEATIENLQKNPELANANHNFQKKLPSKTSKHPNYNSFLCIYAHMGEEGMQNANKLGDNEGADAKAGAKESWENLFINIKDYVSTLWLAGCNSASFAQKYLSNFQGGKLKTLLVTAKELCWCDLLKYFQKEYGMEKITFSDEIILEIAKEKILFAMNINYYVADRNGELKLQTLSENDNTASER